MNGSGKLSRILMALGAIAGIAITWDYYSGRATHFDRPERSLLAMIGGLLGAIVGGLGASIINRVRNKD